MNEDDDFMLGNSNSEEYIEAKSLNGFQMTDVESVQSIDKTQTEDNIENLNIDNIEIDEDIPRKKRKLSPIVYNRSTSSSPLHTKQIITPTVSVKRGYLISNLSELTVITNYKCNKDQIPH